MPFPSPQQCQATARCKALVAIARAAVMAAMDEARHRAAKEECLLDRHVDEFGVLANRVAEAIDRGRDEVAQAIDRVFGAINDWNPID
jgi:hypothetical protein